MPSARAAPTTIAIGGVFIKHCQYMVDAFDAPGLLNPGKVIPSLHRCAEYGRMHVKRGLLPFSELPRF